MAGGGAQLEEASHHTNPCHNARQHVGGHIVMGVMPRQGWPFRSCSEPDPSPLRIDLNAAEGRWRERTEITGRWELLKPEDGKTEDVRAWVGFDFRHAAP